MGKAEETATGAARLRESLENISFFIAAAASER